MKAIIEIKADMRDLLLVINDNPRYRKIYDPSFYGGHTIFKVNEHLCLAYCRVKKVGFVSGREFIFFTYWRVDDNGRVIILCFSDDESEKHIKCDPELVRGRLPIGGWVFDPVGEGRIKVTYFAEMDFAGNVPSFLLVPAFKDQA